MVEIVELSSSEEHSDATVPPESLKTDESNSSSAPESTKNHSSEVKVESQGSEADKKESPKNSHGDPVKSSSPASGNDEASSSNFTFTSNSLQRENDRGKELFVKGDYDSAIQVWSKSIDNLSSVLDKARNNPDHNITEDALHEFTKMYVIFCSNLALAHIKKENYDKCKEYCQYVLMYDDKSLKAHLRIVQADIKLNNFEQALKNCNKGLQFHPDNHELLSLRTRINDEMRSYRNLEKTFFQRAFKNIEVDPRTKQVRSYRSLFSSLRLLNHRLNMLHYRLYFFFRRVLFFFHQVYLSTKASVKHTYTRITRPLNRFLKKLKLS